jgi:hypothetical protein
LQALADGNEETKEEEDDDLDQPLFEQLFPKDHPPALDTLIQHRRLAFTQLSRKVTNLSALA